MRSGSTLAIEIRGSELRSKFEQSWTRISNLKHGRSTAPVSKNRDSAPDAAGQHLWSKFGDRNFDRNSTKVEIGTWLNLVQVWSKMSRNLRRTSNNFEQEFLTWNMGEVPRLSAKTGIRPHTQRVDTCDRNSGIEILIKIQAILNKNV